MRYSIALLAIAAAVQSSPVPQAVTAAISPTAPSPPGCSPTYVGTFGIAVMNITASSQAAVGTISDGQPQASTAGTAVKTISDGQPQATTGTAVKTISDGQPQAATMTMSVAPVTQISDGQIQATSMMTMAPINQIGDGQIQNPKMTVTAVSQISDGQIQASTGTAVKTISDGQPQAPTGTAVKTISDGQPQAPTGTAVKTISDGQPQAPTATGTGVKTISDGQPQAPTATGTGVKTLSDGQPQATGTATSSGSGTAVAMVACKATDTLEITLAGGVLTDNKGRTGYIASNYQFQFDGPPQAGAIYTAGWSVCGNGSLALGGSNVFYQCLSGNFYNLYDRNWAPQCVPITINAIQLINC